MAQYKTGTVSVTNGSATVTGSGTLWSGEIAAGDLFTIVGDNAWYEVASVGSNTSITLSANYAGTTGSGKSYAISRDFTTRLALPYPQKGDIETASIIKRAFEQIDTETNIATANYSATSAPTANDDSGDGYSIGSWWVNVTSDEAYLCVDATVGAAVWTKISVDVPSEIVALLAGQSVSMASLTLSGGTANGVLYLNGSKVATSGSALTFDGTTLTVGAAASVQINSANYVGAPSFGVRYNASNARLGINIGNSNGFPYIGYNTNNKNGSDTPTYDLTQAATQFRMDNGQFIWNRADSGTAGTDITWSEAMRLTSTGLGVGTSSPSVKLHSYTSGNTPILSETSGGVTSYLGLKNTGGMAYIASQNNNILFATSSNADTRATLDSSGNLGLGVTPSAWTLTPALQVVGASVLSTGNDMYLSANAYYGSSAWTYRASAYATQYYQLNGQHVWRTAASGTAGTAITFTQAMTLDANGRLNVGSTSFDFAVRAGFRGDSSSVPTVEIQNESSTGKMLTFRTNGESEVGSVSYTASSTAYNTSSDYRLKNITGPITNSGAYIDSLNPVEGTWKIDGSTFVGLIAHEVQEASRTNVATGVKDGEQMQGMDYSSAEIIANLIAEVKSLRARVAALES